MTTDISGNPQPEGTAAFGDILPPRENYPDAALALTIKIVMAGRRWRALIDEHLRDKGHSASRMEAMASIAYSPPGTTQIQVAKRIGIEGPTLTRTLDMLETDGLVERMPDPNDRRNKHMRLTPAGCKALAEMFAITSALRARLLDGMPAADIAQADGFLAEINTRLEGGACTAEG